MSGSECPNQSYMCWFSDKIVLKMYGFREEELIAGLEAMACRWGNA